MPLDLPRLQDIAACYSTEGENSVHLELALSLLKEKKIIRMKTPDFSEENWFLYKASK